VLDLRSRRPALSPSILNADFGHLAAVLRQLEHGGADYVHLDVMDGRFVPNISFGLPVVEAARRATNLPLDVHLMIVEPERYIDDFVAAGASIVTVQVEACVHLHRTVQQIHAAGALAGVALNPATPLAAVEEIVPFVELVLVMTVDPGYGGQTLIPATLRKVERLRRLIDDRGLPAVIEVDGGIKASNMAAVLEAGADVVVTGSAAFPPDGSTVEAVQALRRAMGRL
jgi:ribulose-phosphate 3-epimerase